MAGPGLDLRGAWTLSTGRGGGECFGHISIKIMLKINRERIKI